MPRQVRVAAALAATIAVAAAPRAAALSSSIIGVPDRMIPSQSILKADFGKASVSRFFHCLQRGLQSFTLMPRVPLTAIESLLVSHDRAIVIFFGERLSNDLSSLTTIPPFDDRPFWQLIPLDIALSSVKESDALAGSDAIKSHTGKHGAVCFVVRRPGEEGGEISAHRFAFASSPVRIV